MVDHSQQQTMSSEMADKIEWLFNCHMGAHIINCHIGARLLTVTLHPLQGSPYESNFHMQMQARNQECHMQDVIPRSLEH